MVFFGDIGSRGARFKKAWGNALNDRWGGECGGGRSLPPPAIIRRAPDRLSLARWTPPELASVSPAAGIMRGIASADKGLGPGIQAILAVLAGHGPGSGGASEPRRGSVSGSGAWA